MGFVFVTGLSILTKYYFFQAGSVTVDLAAETGGNIGTTKRDELVVTSNGVKCIGKFVFLQFGA